MNRLAMPKNDPDSIGTMNGTDAGDDHPSQKYAITNNGPAIMAIGILSSSDVGCGIDGDGSSDDFDFGRCRR
jgi:hypothetical protein